MLAILLIQVDNHLCIASGRKDMPLLLELVADFAIVINLSIENNAHSVILIIDWLVPAFQVNNAESASPQEQSIAMVVALPIGTTMPDSGYHVLKKCLVISS
jgi:hypothetical protein